MANDRNLDELIDYAQHALGEGYPYEVTEQDLALTLQALRAFKASQSEPSENSDEEPAYPFEMAFHIARCWRVGKMIGGDEDGVRNALLAEVERLLALNRQAEPSPPRNALRGMCQLQNAPACDNYPECQCGTLNRSEKP